MSDSRIDGLTFGAAIAFIVPGLLAFKGLTYHSKTFNVWMIAAQSHDQSLGVFLFILLAATALGIGVSGARALVIDSFFYSRLAFGWRVTRPAILWNRLDDEGQRTLAMIIDGYYRYYQCYANSLVGLAVFVVCRLALPKGGGWPASYWVALSAVAFCLLWSSHDSFRKYTQALGNLFIQSDAKEGT